MIATWMFLKLWYRIFCCQWNWQLKKTLSLCGLTFLFCSSTAWPQRYAVLVGHNSGGPKVEKLLYAEKDVLEMREVLHTCSGFTSDNIYVALHPTIEGVDSVFNSCIQAMVRKKNNAETLLFLYYSGHATDANLLLGDTTYPLEKVRAFINSNQASVTIALFDACQSGIITSFKGSSVSEPFYLKQEKVQGKVILASTTAQEQAQESDALKGSIFTHHFINGIRGSADVSDDQRVSISEAYQYAYRKTIETTALSGAMVQHPMFRFNIVGQGEIILSDFTSHQASGILFDYTFSGKVLVFDEYYNEIYADFYKSSDMANQFVSLKPGRYTTIYIENAVTKMHQFTISDNKYIYKAVKKSFDSPLHSRIQGKGHVTYAESSEIVEQNVSSPLSIYSSGICFGALLMSRYATILKKTSVKIAWINELYIAEHTQFIGDIFSIVPGRSIAAQVGFIFQDKNWSSFAPFCSVALGLWCFIREPLLRVAMAPQGQISIGVLQKLTKRADVKVSLPLTAVMLDKTDIVLGLDISFVVRGKYADIRTILP